MSSGGPIGCGVLLGIRLWGDGFEVLGEATNSGRNKRDWVRFKASGYEYVVDRTSHKNNKVYDPYKPSVSGIGWLGEPDRDDLMFASLYKSWNNALARCHMEGTQSYYTYGAIGIRVCNRWKSFANYQHDVRRCLGWYYKEKHGAEYALDKDHFQSGYYAPDTCVWIPNAINVMYARTTPFEATALGGTTYTHVSESTFAKLHGLTQSRVNEALRLGKPTKGWRFHYVNRPWLRCKAPVDQLDEVVRCLLRGEDGHLVAAAWSPEEGDGPRPTTRIEATFFIEEGVLSCDLRFYNVDTVITQRAVSGYALVVHVLATVLGVAPGSIHVDTDIESAGYHEVRICDLMHHNDLSANNIELGSFRVPEKPPIKFAQNRTMRGLHGESQAGNGGKSTYEYNSWSNMKVRCYNTTSDDYPNYGGRGITVDPTWLGPYGYETFLKDMGRRPGPEYSIDRIDTNGSYTPENCRWATRAEQNRNKRSNIVLTVDGETKIAEDWAQQFGLKSRTLRARLARGWDHERAVKTPV